MRVLKNPSERAFQEEAARLGWDISKRGWPDFFCMVEGKVRLVEVKRKRNSLLRKNQYLVMKAFSELGVPCYQWSPQGGFRLI